jgi:hypothetical protein
MDEQYRILWALDGEAFYVVFDNELEKFDANGFLLDKPTVIPVESRKPFTDSQSVQLSLIKNSMQSGNPARKSTNSASGRLL